MLTRSVGVTPGATVASERAPGNAAVVPVNGADLRVQTFGDLADRAILLIHGAAAPVLGWEDEFCHRLAFAARFVIRYDHRAVDRFDGVAGPTGPTLRDLTADAVGLLDAHGLARAHLVGRSVGGMIALLAALDHPERVASLTLIGMNPGSPGLSPATPFSAIVGQRRLDSADRAVIDQALGLLRLSAHPSDWSECAAMPAAGECDLGRTLTIAGSRESLSGSGDRLPFRARLGDIRAPALIVHGAEDPVFPHRQALALAREIPGARVLTLERTGHELPRAEWDRVVAAVERHTSKGGCRRQ